MKEFLEESLNYCSGALLASVSFFILFFIINWIFFGFPDSLTLKNGFQWNDLHELDNIIDNPF